MPGALLLNYIQSRKSPAPCISKRPLFLNLRYGNHPSRARGPRPGEKLPVLKLFRRARPAVPAQLPREDAAVWHGAARLLGTAPCTAHCQKPRPSYSRLCAVSTRQSRPLLRAAPRQRGRFFIIFGPLSAICCLRISRSPRLPRCVMAPSSAVCWPRTIGASTNTRSCHAFHSVWRPMLAPGAIAHARGGKWQDFGRFRARSRTAGCP